MHLVCKQQKLRCQGERPKSPKTLIPRRGERPSPHKLPSRCRAKLWREAPYALTKPKTTKAGFLYCLR